MALLRLQVLLLRLLVLLLLRLLLLVLLLQRRVASGALPSPCWRRRASSAYRPPSSRSGRLCVGMGLRRELRRLVPGFLVGGEC